MGKNRKSDSEDRGQKIVDLYEQLTAMPEYKVLEKIKALEISKYVFQTNYADLRNVLTANVDVNKIRGMREADRRLRMTAIQFEISRILHNFVASVESYIEHTRILYRELYKKTGNMPEYEPEIERRFNNQLVHFFKDLCKYCLRFQAPPVSSSLYWSQINAVYNTGVKLDKDELGKYTKWSQAGKKYLTHQTNQLDLLSVVNEYYALVIDFCSWFQSRQKEIHSAEIARVDAIQSEIESLLKQEYSRS